MQLDGLLPAFVRATNDFGLEPEPIPHDGAMRTPPSEWELDWSEDDATTTMWGSERAALAYAACFVQRRLPPQAPPPPPPASMRMGLEHAHVPELVLEAAYPTARGTQRHAARCPELSENALVHAHASHPSWKRSLLGAFALFTAVFFMRFLLSGFPIVEVPKPHTLAREPSLATEGRAAKPKRVSPQMSEIGPSAELTAPKAVASAVAARSGKRQHSKAARTQAQSMAAPASRAAKSRSAREVANTMGGRPSAAAQVPVLVSKAAGTGVLRVNSLPWADVYVDAKRVGTTPQTNLVLSAGKHQVTLVNAEFEMSKTFMVNVVKGKLMTKIVNLSL